MCLNIPKRVYLKQHFVQAHVYKHSVLVFGMWEGETVFGTIGVERKWWHPERERKGEKSLGCGPLKDWET